MERERDSEKEEDKSVRAVEQRGDERSRVVSHGPRGSVPESSLFVSVTVTVSVSPPPGCRATSHTILIT